MSEIRSLGNIRLLEVFSDVPIVIRGNYAGRHKAALYIKTPTCSDVRINIQKLKKIYSDLAKRCRDKPYTFYCEPVKIKGLKYWRFGRRSLDKKERVRLKDVPLYYSTKFKALYVPKSYVSKKPRLVSSVVSYRLRDLGISHKTEVKRSRN